MSKLSIILHRAPAVRKTLVLGAAVCLLLGAVIWRLATQSECLDSFDNASRPLGYHWKTDNPNRRFQGFYGYDPLTKRHVYVGPDGRYYTFAHQPPIAPDDLKSLWCPHDAGKPPFERSKLADVLRTVRSIFAPPDRLLNFSSLRRPRGYHWKAARSPDGGETGYYGTDPSNGWTVYVGSRDNIFYSFPHRAPLTSADLSSLWEPHDANLRH